MNNYELLLRTEARIIKLKDLSKELNKTIAGSKAIVKEYIDQLIEETYRMKELCEKEFPDKIITDSLGIWCEAGSKLDVLKEKIRKEIGDRCDIVHFEEAGHLFIDVNEKDLDEAIKLVNRLLSEHEDVYDIYKPEKVETLDSRPMFIGEDDPISYCEKAGIDIDVSLPEDVKSRLVSKMEASLLEHTNKCKAFLNLVEGRS